MEEQKKELKVIENTVRGLINTDTIKAKFADILGDKAKGFMASVINSVNSNAELSKVNPQSVILSALVAATLDLPIDKNLGFSYIVPYGKDAQFQIGYKGFIQLALRTGQYLKLNVTPVYSNQFKSWNSLTEDIQIDFTKEGKGEIKGFAVYFKLINGFEKTNFFYKKSLLEHGKKYSKAFNNGPWKTNTDEMCMKTAIKLTLSKWGILSIEMQTATKADQAVICSEDINTSGAFNYIDNPLTNVQYNVTEDSKPEEEKIKVDKETGGILYENGITPDQIVKIKTMQSKLGMDTKTYINLLGVYGVETCTNLTKEQASELIDELEKIN